MRCGHRSTAGSVLPLASSFVKQIGTKIIWDKQFGILSWIYKIFLGSDRRKHGRGCSSPSVTQDVQTNVESSLMAPQLLVGFI